MVSKVATVFSGKKFVFQVARGFCGSALLHSLVDSHPAVLTLPDKYSYDFLDQLKEKSPDGVIDYFKNVSRLRFMIRGVRRNASDPDFSSANFDSHTFLVCLRNFLADIELNKKNICLAVHYAYACVMAQDIESVKTVYVHLTMSGLDSVAKDFPDAKFIEIVRHPVSSFHSALRTVCSLKNRVECASLADSFLPFEWFEVLNDVCVRHKRIDRFLENLNGGRFLFIKFEELHCCPEKVTREIAAWIGVPFYESLLQSTFMGLPYVSSGALNKNVSGFSARMAEARYKDFFNRDDICFHEALFSPYMKKYGYSLENDLMPISLRLRYSINKGDVKNFFSFLFSRPVFDIQHFRNIVSFLLYFWRKRRLIFEYEINRCCKNGEGQTL